MDLGEALKGYAIDNDLDILSAAFKSNDIQMVAKENFKDPGKVIFIKDGGKVGFLSRNSIPVEIGDIVQGFIREDNDSYFILEVQKIIF